MTGTQDKVRSLFLTALMIGSVFAGTIALAGTAAAATNTSYGITNAGDNNRYLTSNPGNTYTTSGTVEFSGNPTVAETEVVIENADLGAVQPGDITVTVAGTPYTLQSGEVDIGTDEFTVDWSALRNRVGAIDIQDGDTVQFTVLDVQNPDEAGRHDFQVTHFDSEGNSLDNYRKQLKIADENLAGGRFWQGQQLHIGYGGAQTLELYEVERNSSGARIITSSGFVAEINIDGSGNGLINTNNLEGEYAIADANQNIQDIQAGGTVVAGGTLQGGADTFTVSVQSLSAAFDSNTVAVGEQVDIEFTSNRNVFNVTVSADGLGTDELADIFSSAGIVSQDDDENEVTFHVDGDQVVTTDFTDIDTGEYTFDFQVADTAASATSTITVQEEADAEATVGVGGVARARVGDIARVPIQLTNTDNARVNLGFNNVNFNLTLEIQDGNDDGQAG
ncbi:MAG: surface glycoprotein, partial [Halorientalis sp.]